MGALLAVRKGLPRNWELSWGHGGGVALVAAADGTGAGRVVQVGGAREGRRRGRRAEVDQTSVTATPPVADLLVGMPNRRR